MQTSEPLTKTILMLAICPSFAVAEGVWEGLEAGAENACERGRSLSLDAPDPVRND
jgi:hypothetical protein